MPISPSPQLDLEFGKTLRDTGISLAEASAEDILMNWKEYAYWQLVEFLRYKPLGWEFMIEDFREYVKAHLVQPHSQRAYGGIALRAARNKIIEKVRTTYVKNTNAHMAFASVWKKV